MNRVFSAELSSEGIKSLIGDIKDYRLEFIEKCDKLSHELAKVGSKKARDTMTGHEYKRFVSFTTKDLKHTNMRDSHISYVIGRDRTKLYREWYHFDYTSTVAEVSPLLMAEFGSGQRAKNPLNVPGVGKGTFPNANPRNYNNPKGWKWADTNPDMSFATKKPRKDGLPTLYIHKSKGEKPVMPMWNARNEIVKECRNIVNEVFK